MEYSTEYSMEYSMEYENLKMEYSKINLQQGNIEIFGIWNIPGIFQKKPSTSEILKFLEYGI